MITKFKLIPKYYLGQNVVIDYLPKELKKHQVKTALLVAGGGSIKRNKLYDHIKAACKRAHVKLIEHWGIEPNPRDEGIYRAALLARKTHCDLIIAAGGGSVIDAAKVVGIVAKNPVYKDAWSYVLDNSRITKPSIPLFSIITLAATGSENNAGSVINNAKTSLKYSVETKSAIPLVCFEDPMYTMTLSPWQTACGIFDVFSHLMEQYYDSATHMFAWTQQYLLASMKVVVNCANRLAKNNSDYLARTELLWTSSMALNNLGTIQTNGGDWMTHRLEHAVSALWDVEHGAGLALICPTYLYYMCNVKKNKIFIAKSLEIGQNVFQVKTLSAYFKKLNEFIALLKLPKRYGDFNNVKNVSDANIQFLNKHFNGVVRNKQDMAKYVFSHIKP